MICVSGVREALILKTTSTFSKSQRGRCGVGPVLAKPDGLKPHHPRQIRLLVSETLLGLKGHPMALRCVLGVR